MDGSGDVQPAISGNPPASANTNRSGPQLTRHGGRCCLPGVHRYGGAAFMVPSKSRPELVARIRASGLTQQEIADTAGVGVGTVNRDLDAADFPSGKSDTPVTNSRGQQRPATYSRAEPDVIDAEIVEEEG